MPMEQTIARFEVDGISEKAPSLRPGGREMLNLSVCRDRSGYMGENEYL